VSVLVMSIMVAFLVYINQFKDDYVEEDVATVYVATVVVFLIYLIFYMITVR